MSTKGIVKGIISNLIIVEVDGPVSQNEIAYIIEPDTKLMSEVKWLVRIPIYRC